MAGTYSQIYIQVVFAVKHRENLLHQPWREEVFKYISTIIADRNQKPIIVNGVSDHVHLFLGFSPGYCLSDVVRDVKNNTTNFINNRHFLQRKFAWQSGYGAFSYSRSQIQRVCQYIQNQESHHREQSFRKEYTALLEKFNISYDQKYLFDWFD